MNRFDFTPFRRSMVGFDRLFDQLESQTRTHSGDNYPPFNIEKRGDDAYRITLAVAGFKPGDFDITADEHDELLDHGEVILQREVPRLPDDTLETLSARILAEEHTAYVEAVKKLVS